MGPLAQPADGPPDGGPSPLAQVYQQTKDMDPARAGQVADIARRTGQPLAYVDQNFDGMQKAQNEPDWSKMEMDTPQAAQFLSNPVNMAAYRDKVHALQSMESSVQDYSTARNYGDALLYGLNKLGSGIARMPGFLADMVSTSLQQESKDNPVPTDNLTPEQIAALKATENEPIQHVPQEWINNPIAKFFDEQASTVAPPSMSQPVISNALKGNMRPLLTQITAGIPQLGLLAAGPEAGPLLMGGTQGSETEGKALQQGANPNAALQDATLQSVFGVLAMKYGTLPVLKNWAGVLENQAGRATAWTLARNLGKAAAANLSIGTAQGAANSFANDFADYATDVNPKAMDGWAQRALDNAVVMGGTSLALMGPAALHEMVGRNKTALDLQQAQTTAGNTQKLLSDLDKGTADSRDPKAPLSHQDFVEQATKGTPAENLYAPVEAVKAYYQTKGQDPGAEMDKAGLADSYQEAVKTGGHVVIPTNVWTDLFANTEAGNALKPDIKTDPADLSAREVASQKADLQKQSDEAAQFHADVQKGVDEYQASEAGKDFIKQVSGQLKAAGYEGKDSATLAKTLSGYEVMAQRAGMPIRDFLDKYAPTIKGIDKIDMDQVDGLFQKGQPVNKLETPGNEKGIIGKTVEKAKSLLGMTPKETPHQELFLDTESYKSTEAAQARIADRVKKFQAQEKPDKYDNTHVRTFDEDGYEVRGNHDDSGSDTAVREGIREGEDPKRQMADRRAQGNEIEQSLLRSVQGKFFADRYADSTQPGEQTARLRDSQIKRDISNAKTGKDRPGDAFYQKDAGAVVKGRFYIGNAGKYFIDLTKAKDLSTFLHESGHAYLEILKDLAAGPAATDDIKSMWADTQKYLGHKDGQALTTEQHEKFAKSFEAYLAEGKAPTRRLQAVFSRFKTWLSGVYQHIKQQLGVNLDPSIRSVFDRIYATQDEIARAQHETGYLDLPVKGLSKEAAADLERVKGEARTKAEEELLKPQMEELTKQHQKFLDQERERLTDEANRSIDQGPVFQDMAKLKDTLGKDPLDAARRIIDGKGSTEETTAFEAAAAKRGIGGAHDMARAALEADADRQNQVDLHVQSGMEPHQDLMLTPAIREKAMEALHGERGGELLALENHHLQEALKPGSALKQAVNEANAERARRAGRLAKAQAGEILSRKTLSDAGNYRVYLTQERNAAVAKAKAMAAKDAEGVARAGRQQLLNHALAAAAMKNRESIQGHLDFFQKFTAKDEDITKTRDVDLVNVGRALLGKFGFGEGKGSPTVYLENLKQYSTDSDTYANWLDRVESLSEGAQHKDFMTLGQLSDLSKAVHGLWELSRNVRMIEVNGKMMDRQEVMAKLMERNTSSITPPRKAGESDQDYTDRVEKAFADRKAKTQRAPTEAEKTKVGLLDLKAATGMVQFWAEKMDGDAKDRPYMNSMVFKVRDAANNYRVDKVKWFQKIHDVLKPIEADLDHRPIPAPELKYTFRGTAEILGALQHTGNASNFQKLLRGNGWGDWLKDEETGKPIVDENGEKSLDTSKWDAFTARMQKEGILKKSHYDAVQGLWDVYEGMRPNIQEAHKRMYGFNFDEVPPRGLTTPYGDYKGGYVPAKVDPYKNDDAKTRQEKDALEGQYNGFAWPTTGKGATLKRVENYAAPLLMDLTLATNHLDWALRFTHIEPHIKELGRIVFDKNFRSSLKQVDPSLQSGMLAPYLQRSARQRVDTPSENPVIDKVFQGLRKRTGQIMLTANVADTLSRLMSLPMASLKVGPGHLANGLLTYLKNPQGVAEANAQESKFMATRHGISGFDVTQGIHQILNPSTWQKMGDWTDKHAYALQEVVHHVMDNTVYLAAKNQALNEIQKANPNMGQDELLRKSIQDAEDKVVKTQGSFNPEDVSRTQTGEAWKQTLNMFWGFFNTQANLLGLESHKVFQMQGVAPKFARGLFVFTMGVALPAIWWTSVHNLMAGKSVTGKNEDDDNTTGSYLSWFFGSIGDQALQAIPFAGPLAKGLVEGKMEDNPIVETIENAEKFTRGEDFKALEEGRGKARKTVRDALATVQLLSGLPTAWAARPASYLAGMANDEYEPSSAADLARGLVSGTPKR